jgi:DNA-directed RNA polymerase specialized sigma24 family protein
MSLKPHDPVAARLVDPQLDGRLRRYLRRKMVPDGEIDEVLGVARMQLFEQGLPATPVEVDKLLFRIAHRRAMDFHREQKPELMGEATVRAAFRRRRAPDELPSAPPEAERALAALDRLTAENPRYGRAFEAIKQKMNGKSLERFAAESGVSPGTLRQWVNRFRAVARKRMPQYVNFFVILLVCAIA